MQNNKPDWQRIGRTSGQKMIRPETEREFLPRFSAAC
jgi:hypothetical protein